MPITTDEVIVLLPEALNDAAKIKTLIDAFSAQAEKPIGSYLVLAGKILEEVAPLATMIESAAKS